MPESKQKCKEWKQRHLPTTGKKCLIMKEQETLNQNELSQNAAVTSGATGLQMMPGVSTDGQQMQIL